MAAYKASDVLGQIATRIDAITSETPDAGFKRSAYRFKIEDEPEGAIDGLYFVDLEGAQPYQRNWGTSENVIDGRAVVYVAYSRPGGDRGEGDRQTVLRNAADDCQRIADMVEDPNNYSSTTSGIREIRFQGYERVQDLPRAEVWAVRFFVQWRSDMITS